MGKVAQPTGMWHDPGLPAIALRRVLVRDPAGRFDASALRSPDPALAPTGVVTSTSGAAG